MSSQAISLLSPEKYLEIERAAERRSEYLNGRMYLMAGGTRAHSWIVANVLSRLSEQLRGQRCGAAGGGLRVFSAEYGIFTYPDIVVTCGPDRFLDGHRDTITDATFIAEVLSPSTMSYGRGEKFLFYRSLPSFAEYLLIAQDRFFAERYSRQADGAWVMREFKAPEDQIELTPIGCGLTLGSLYERVEFGSPE